MSKINAIRFINLNYNHNGIRVDDEAFHLNGESTLLTLRNGGGKSVFVQMLIAPFVHKRYRDFKDRNFSSYFTTNKPTFILVEWKLDGNSGYVLTGMMVRKSQEIGEEGRQNDLDIIQFIHEYKKQNQYDIHKIPFIKIENEIKTLKTFGESRSLLESLKTSHEYSFFSYDMNNNYQQRNYYSKLEEYQIYCKEWESIIRNINLKESGLSELFTDTKDEIGLIKKWFLPTIEDKLNKEKNRIEEFRDILGQYVKQYKSNKSKIDQKHTIITFKEETAPVLEIAKNVENFTKQKSDFENKIANLILRLRELSENLQDKSLKIEEKDAILHKEIERIKHEESSFLIYGLKDELSNILDENDKLEGRLSEAKKEEKDLIKRKNIQECAHIYERYREASSEVQILENKLEIIKDKEKDRTPEREALGTILRSHYEKELHLIKGKLFAIEEEIKKLEGQDKTLESKSNILKNEEVSQTSSLSKINANISNYDRVENKFNNTYKEDLGRNILGYYEEGSLEIRIKRLKELIEESSLNLIRLKKLSLENDEKHKVFTRQIENKTGENATMSQKIIGEKEKFEGLQAKFEVRKSIIRHIGFKEEQIFDTEDILMEFKRRKDQVEEDKKVIEIEIRDLKNEYKKLKSGKMLELPQEIKRALDAEGINYIYGMEWLKHNKKTLAENHEIIKNNPFIPYSLIISNAEFRRLKDKNLGIYTSFPIPIVARENLERKFDGYEQTPKSTSVFSAERVNFYLMFNNDLLNEAELSKILANKEEEIKERQAALNKRQDDFSEYDGKYQLIFHQGLTKKIYFETKKSIQSLQKAKEAIEDELETLKNDQKNAGKAGQELSEKIDKLAKVLDMLRRKDKDLEELFEDYKEYLSLKKEGVLISDEISKIRNESKALKEKIKSLRQTREKTQESRLKVKEIIKETNKKLEEFLKHKKEWPEKALNYPSQKDIEDVEARYLALTKEITSELKDVEDNLTRANNKFKKIENELISRSSSLEVKEEEYINEKYDSFILESAENAIKALKMKIDQLIKSSSDINSKIAVKKNEISTEMKNLKDRIGKEELLDKKELVLTDFKKRIKTKQDDLKKLKGEMKLIGARIAYCDNNLSALAEYKELPLVEDVEFSVNIPSMDKESLDNFRGKLIRDYRAIWEKINKIRNQLSIALDKCLRNSAFQEDFFYRPINTLYSLLEEPSEFIEQLETTIKSYDDLIIKLEVDISFVDKEKERVTQLLLDYIKDLHQNLGKIDKNSTVKIGERPIKMLKIDLPDWEIQEKEFESRLKEMIEDLTRSGINRLENNENIEDVISPVISTNNLYNTVVGIGNIRIRLYKIEAQRQYQIDWADVSKNSGGEGFLSAFVILSSLLSFMRRDDTDIFAELEEGKSIIMDNPFAQTNAPHLLAPLMDLAQKTNTQLIAFTGLSGEAIYNSFDNIYVLNLIPSKLKKGMQYLKSNHSKGDETEILELSQVRVEEMDQLKLF